MVITGASSGIGLVTSRMADKIMERTMIKQQHWERDGYVGHVAESSLYTRASLHPLLTGPALVGSGISCGGLSAHETCRRSLANRPAFQIVD